MSLTLDQMRALKEALKSVGLKAGARLGIDIAIMEAFFGRLQDLIDATQVSVKFPYSVVLSVVDHGSVLLLSTNIMQGAVSGENQFKVDFDLRVITMQSASLKEVDVAERSEKEGSLEVVVEPGGLARAFLRGVTIGVWGPSNAGFRRQPTQWPRPMAEFDKILNAHVESDLVAERGVRYWADRKKRILMTGSDGTERLFQHRLYWWLDNFVSDAVSVNAESRGLGQDSTDVTVVTQAGSHVVEVKWLGINEASTKFKNPPRINQGLKQVYQYLQRDPRLVCGHLVIYDGRPRGDYESSSRHDDQLRHPRCVHPYLVFLDSTVPSEVTLEPSDASAVKSASVKNAKKHLKKTNSKDKLSKAGRGKKGKSR